MSKWIPVLAIEDDEIVREALRRSLKLYGFQVHLAKDGPEGLKLAHEAKHRPFSFPPRTTMLGALVGHLRTPHDDFQPSNVMWSMVPPIEGRRLPKRARRDAQSERALQDLGAWLTDVVESGDAVDGSARQADRRVRAISRG